MGDIKDIAGFLEKLDDRYFTVDICSIPVVDMERAEYRELFDDLFERMEQYRPDDAGIFTECLLPYEFTRLSTGEYQYAKVLGRDGGLFEAFVFRQDQQRTGQDHTDGRAGGVYASGAGTAVYRPHAENR